MILCGQVGTTEAQYNFTALEGDSASSTSNTLDPYHTIYVLADDGTYGSYTKEPIIRRKFEKYIKTKTTIESLTEKGNDNSDVIMIFV